ncbi:MAG: metal ABC transporter substrate-binding protein [Calditrichia bacterium]
MKTLGLIWIILITFFGLGRTDSGYVTTILPFKMILQDVIGRQDTVFTILPPGASPHTYEIKPSEISRIEKSRALFYGAENLDGWVRNVAHSHPVKLLEMLPSDRVLSIDKINPDGDRQPVGPDPHFWSDPLAVKALLPALVDTLCRLQPEGCTVFRKNAEIFSAHLDTLHRRIQQQLFSLGNPKVLLSHPFFQYYLKRFGFEIMGIIETIPGTEPTPKDLRNLIELAKRHQAQAILVHAQHSPRAAELIAEAAALKLIRLDPIGGIPGRETYEKWLQYNTRLLVEGLK